MSQECLILGAESSGKTLFAQRLKAITETQFDASTATESTIATVGVELHHVTINSIAVKLREIGSAISSRWSLYLADCCYLIYLVDISDPGSISSAVVLLHELLVYKNYLSDKPILLVLNKTDSTDEFSREIAINSLRLDELLRDWNSGTGAIDVIIGNAVDGSSCYQALRWLMENVS